ncbi:ion channel [Deinococcus sp.]|uniref:ion channel n=1 Tax=Deinococcus sp. TaxID=47478 RepID=UPI0025E2C4E0|nr:ion channel [Deinococcus sp.]
MTSPFSRPPDDLGLGRVVSEESGERYLNKDGTFNVERRGLGWQAISVYGALLTAPWWLFFLSMGGLYLALNALFGLAYFSMGAGALSELPRLGEARYLACFFFSVQTFGTIGYGHVYPVSLAAELTVTLEAFVSLLGVALATGVLFARFSRPQSRILFSHWAVVAPFEGGQALMFRLVNGRRSQLMNARIEVVHTQFTAPKAQTAPETQTPETQTPEAQTPEAQTPPGQGAPALTAQRRKRSFTPLELERAQVTLFPLAWTIVHPITPQSPYWGATPQSLRDHDAEILVLFSALDEAVQQTIHARSSYKAHELRWHHRFSDLFRRSPAGELYVDIAHLSGTEATPPVKTPSR